MLNRFSLGSILIAGLVLTFTGCSNTQVGTIQISPSTQALTADQTVQFIATGVIGHGAHPTSSQDVTNLVTWSSSTTDVATVSSSGLATAVSAGTTTITASMAGSASATATITVTGASGGGGSSAAASLTIIPGAQSVAMPGQTSQFIAIGTATNGATEDLTSLVSWTSSSEQVAKISSAGLATAFGQGTTTITAIFTHANNSVITGTATLTVMGGTSEPVVAISVYPGSVSLSASGQTAQLVALGTSGSTGLNRDVTNAAQLKWTSAVPTIASVTANGLVAGVSAGTTTIMAEWTNPDTTVESATADITVSLTSAPEPLLSLTIIPGAITVGDLQDTGQFLAIGTFATVPYVRDLTNAPGTTWISSFPDTFPVNTNSGGTPSASAGIVTAYGTGTAAIIAEATSPDGTIQTATATFSCPLVLPNPNGNPPTPGSCWTGQVGPLKATLTVFGEGLNTTDWLVTASSATGTPDVIHCGPGWAANGQTGGSVCVGIYPIGSTVILTTPAQAGAAFGGWTFNCTPTAPITAAGPNSCRIVLGTTNASVGAIFN